MKKLLFIVTIMLIVIGCAHGNITSIHKKFENSDMAFFRDVIQQNENVVYFYYVDYGYDAWRRYYGWYCYKFICDKEGNVLQKKEFWIGGEGAFQHFRSSLTSGYEYERKGLKE